VLLLFLQETASVSLNTINRLIFIAEMKCVSCGVRTEFICIVPCLPLETQFRLLIGFITILQAVITITYYTVTYLHSLKSVQSNIPILFGASGIHLETGDR
jgi:hypothetical protein